MPLEVNIPRSKSLFFWSISLSWVRPPACKWNLSVTSSKFTIGIIYFTYFWLMVGCAASSPAFHACYNVNIKFNWKICVCSVQSTAHTYSQQEETSPIVLSSQTIWKTSMVAALNGLSAFFSNWNLLLRCKITHFPCIVCLYPGFDQLTVTKGLPSGLVVLDLSIKGRNTVHWKKLWCHQVGKCFRHFQWTRFDMTGQFAGLRSAHWAEIEMGDFSAVVALINHIFIDAFGKFNRPT